MPLPVTTENAHIAKNYQSGLDETGIRMWTEYGTRGNMTADPCTPKIMQRLRRPFTAVRVEMADNRAWYSSSYFNDFKRQMRSDDALVSIVPLPEIGILHGLGGDRVRGSKPMGRREIVCCNLLHGEIASRWRRKLARMAAIDKRLPPRLGQLLEHLRGPGSEKEIAAQLGLSSHTVHNHIRRLYAALNVRSRAELTTLDRQQEVLDFPRLGIAGL